MLLAFPNNSGSYAKCTGLVRVRSSLLAESRLISFPLGTKIFQFPRSRFFNLCIQLKIPHKEVGSPIRKFTDQSILTTPRNLSQSIASFIAYRCQGIHQTPLIYLILTKVMDYQ